MRIAASLIYKQQNQRKDLGLVHKKCEANIKIANSKAVNCELAKPL